MKPASLFHPCCSQLLAVATFVDKAALKPGYLLVKQVIRLVNQTDEGVGDNGRVGVV